MRANNGTWRGRGLRPGSEDVQPQRKQPPLPHWKHTLSTRALILAALPLVAPAGNADTPQDTLQIATRTSHAPGTPQWRQIHDWLAQHSAAMDGKPKGDPERLGTITLAYSTTRPMTTGPIPQPVPLPATGMPGDTIGIASCAQGHLQTWNYVIDDGQDHRWILQSYSLKQAASCPDGARQG